MRQADTHLKQILIADDDSDARFILEQLLTTAGYAVTAVENGKKALEASATIEFDLALLDVQMPGLSGMQVAEAFKGDDSLKYTPLFLITALGELEDLQRGFAHGADDYIVKPFNLAELSARISSVGRRYTGNPNPIITHGALDIDLASRSIRRDGKQVHLTLREWALFEAVLSRPGQLLSKAQLEEKLYAFDAEIESNTIEVHVSRLRKKLGPGVIETERGLGYRLGAS